MRDILVALIGVSIGALIFLAWALLAEILT